MLCTRQVHLESIIEIFNESPLCWWSWMMTIICTVLVTLSRHSTSLSLMYTLTVFKTSNLILNLEEEAEYHGLLEVTVWVYWFCLRLISVPPGGSVNIYNLQSREYLSLLVWAVSFFAVKRLRAVIPNSPPRFCRRWSTILTILMMYTNYFLL